MNIKKTLMIGACVMSVSTLGVVVGTQVGAMKLGTLATSDKTITLTSATEVVLDYDFLECTYHHIAANTSGTHDQIDIWAEDYNADEERYTFSGEDSFYESTISHPTTDLSLYLQLNNITSFSIQYACGNAGDSVGWYLFEETDERGARVANGTLPASGTSFEYAYTPDAENPVRPQMLAFFYENNATVDSTFKITSLTINWTC